MGTWPGTGVAPVVILAACLVARLGLVKCGVHSTHANYAHLTVGVRALARWPT